MVSYWVAIFCRKKFLLLCLLWTQEKLQCLLKMETQKLVLKHLLLQFLNHVNLQRWVRRHHWMLWSHGGKMDSPGRLYHANEFFFFNHGQCFGCMIWLLVHFQLDNCCSTNWCLEHGQRTSPSPIIFRSFCILSPVSTGCLFKSPNWEICYTDFCWISQFNIIFYFLFFIGVDLNTEKTIKNLFLFHCSLLLSACTICRLGKWQLVCKYLNPGYVSIRSVLLLGFSLLINCWIHDWNM